MVTLLKNLRPFQNYNFKIQWEFIFFDFFKILTETLRKKSFEYKYGHSYFKRKIRKYAYLRIFRLTTSRTPNFIRKADLK